MPTLNGEKLSMLAEKEYCLCCLKRTFVFCLLAILALCLGSCGGGNLGYSSPYVTDISAQDRSLAVGDETRIDIYLDAQADYYGYASPAEVMVLLPAELGYVEGSSRIYDQGFSHTSKRDPNYVNYCKDGWTLLFYSFSQGELESANKQTDGFYESTAEQGFRLRVVGLIPVQEAIVYAVAKDMVNIRCDDVRFTYDKKEIFSVH